MKRKILAWILTASVILSSVTPVVAFEENLVLDAFDENAVSDIVAEDDAVIQLDDSGDEIDQGNEILDSNDDDASLEEDGNEDLFSVIEDMTELPDGLFVLDEDPEETIEEDLMTFEEETAIEEADFALDSGNIVEIEDEESIVEEAEEFTAEEASEAEEVLEEVTEEVFLEEEVLSLEEETSVPEEEVSELKSASADGLSYSVRLDSEGKLFAAVVSVEEGSEIAIIPKTVKVEEETISVTTLATGFADGDSALRQVVVPDSVENIEEGAFIGLNGAIIVCGENSAAHKAAEEQGVDYNINAVSIKDDTFRIATGETKTFGKDIDIFTKGEIAGQYYEKWYSLNEDVAVVSQDGKVEAVSAGTALIGLDAAGIKTEAEVTVFDEETEITSLKEEYLEDVDITSELTEYGAEDYRTRAQGDSRWGGMYIYDLTMRAVGCLITSYSKMVIQAGIQPSTWTPGDQLNWQKANGGLYYNDTIHTAIAKMSPQLNYVGQVNLNCSPAAAAGTVLSYVRGGYYAVLSVSGGWAQGQHWVCLDNAESLSHNAVWMDDSSSATGGNVNSVQARYPKIVKMVLFSSSASAKPSLVPFNDGANYTSETGFRVSTYYYNPGGKRIENLGICLMDANGREIKTYNEPAGQYSIGSYTTKGNLYEDTNADLHYTLEPGTTYKYRFFIKVAGSDMVFSDTYTITTKGDPTPGKPTLKVNKTDIAVGDNVTVSWSADQRATKGYDVTIQSVSAPSYSRTVSVNGASSTSTVLTIPAAGSYKVSAVAKGTRKNSETGVLGSQITGHDPSTVTFIMEDEEGDEKILKTDTVKYGYTAEPPVAPSLEGYTFQGWDSSYKNITADKTVKAQFKINTYTIRFLNDDDTVLKEETVEYKQSVTVPSEPVSNRNGYVFAGWSSEDYNVVKKDADIHATYVWYETTLPLFLNLQTCRYEDTGYTVTYDMYNGMDRKVTGRAIVSLMTSTGKLLATTESSAFTLNPEEESIDNDLFVPYEGVATYASVVIVDRFTTGVPLSYTHTVKINRDWSAWQEQEPEGNYQIENRTEYSYRDKLNTTSSSSALNGWTQTGSTWKWGDYGSWSGWSRTAYTASDSRKVETRTVQDSAGGTINNYYYWRYISGGAVWYTYSASYAQARGGKKYTFSQRVGDAPAMYYVQSVDGHAEYQLKNNNGGKGVYFDNEWWFLESTSSTPATYHTEYRYADRQKVYTYNFEKWGDWSSWGISPVTASSTRQVKTRTVYRFKAPTEQTEDTSGEARSISGNVSADFAGKQLTLLIYKGDEPADYNNEYLSQTTIGENGYFEFDYTLREEPSIETGDFTIALAIAGATDLIYWGTIAAPLPVYTVEFIDSDGTVLSTQEVTKGQNAVLPENPSKDHYRFMGWSETNTNIQDNETIIAQYEPEKYTVNWIDWDRRTIQTDRYEYGETILIPELAEIEGYTLIGWVDENGDVLEEGDTASKSLNLTSVYERQYFDVTFFNWEGQQIKSENVEFGSVVSAPDIDPIEGMVFMGWSTADFLSVKRDMEVYPDFKYLETADTPQTDIMSGELTSAATVHITAEEGAEIFYTTDGTEPNEFSTKYTNAGIVVNSNVVLKYFARVADKNDSLVGVSFYHLIDGEDTDGGLMIKKSSYTAEKGAVIPISYFLSRNDGGDESVVMYSVDPEVVLVEDDGTVRANKAGSTRVVVMTVDHKYADSCDVVVTDNSVPVSNVSLSEPLIVLSQGQTATLSAQVSPGNATDPSIDWASLDNSVATIDENGNVTALTDGTAILRAYAADGSHYAECAVTVTDPAVAFTDEQAIIMTVGETRKLEYEVSGQVDDEFYWISDNPNVLTVDQEGNVTAVAYGFATVVITTEDETVQAEREIFVKEEEGQENYTALADEDVTISGEGDYNGEEIIPTVVVSHDGTELIEGTDYRVLLGDNVNAGNVPVYVIGIGEYTGVVEGSYRIGRRKISEAKVSKLNDEQYTGSAITPAVEVIDGSTELILNKDYTVVYKNNTAKGTATITITGIGNYKDTTSARFVIKDLSSWEIAPVITRAEQTDMGKVTLAWNVTASADAYSIYEIKDGQQVYINKTSAKSYVVNNVTEGSHYYAIKPRKTVSGTLTFGQLSEKALVEVTSYTWKSAPTMNTPEIDKQKVTLSWTSHVQAEGYSVYEVIDGTAKYINRTDQTSYVLNNVSEGEHIYCVKPRQLNESGSWVFGQMSNTVTAVVAAANWKDAPVLSGSVSGGNKVVLSWTPSTPAEAYSVYEYVDGKAVYLNRTSATTYTISNVSDGEHIYSVKPRQQVDGAWVFGNMSNQVSVTVGVSGSWDDAPVLNDPAVSGNNVSLSWTVGVPAQAYSVYEYINGSAVFLKKVDTTLCNLTGIEDGTHVYCVKPRMQNDAGTWVFGKMSNKVTVSIGEGTASNNSYASAAVEAEVYNYLRNTMGLNVAAACGVLANIYAESGFRPTVIGDNGTSYGLCQWHNGRYTNLINHCRQRGMDYSSVQGQMSYLQHELSNSYTGVLNKLKSVPNTQDGAYDAASYWCIYFEVPANRYNVAVSRGNSAKSVYWPKYGGYVDPTPSLQFFDDANNYLNEYGFRVSARYYNPAGRLIEKLGIVLMDANGKEITTYNEPNASTGVGSYRTNGILYEDTTADMKLRLKKGTVYKYKLFIKVSGADIVFTDVRTVKTTGKSDPEVPVPRAEESDVGIGDNVHITWTADENAVNGYSLNVKDAQGNSQVYEVPNPASSDTSVMLPAAGTYEIIMTSKGDSKNVSSEPITVTAHEDVTVEFRQTHDDGTYDLLMEQTVKYGHDAVAPVAPSITGYTFQGWDKPYTKVTEDLIITAVYKIKTFTVKFVNDDGTVLKEDTVEYKSAVIAPEAPTPTKQGYVFAGWNTNEFTSVTKNLTVTATYVWANSSLPILLTVNSCVYEDTGYTVNYSLTNYPDKKTTGRAIVSLKTATGKLLVTTESNAFTIGKGATRTGMSVFVPYEGVATYAEIVIVDSFKTGIPLSASTSCTINRDWSDWSTTQPVGNYDIQSRVEYRYRDKLTTTSSNSSLSGWTQTGSTWAWSNYGNWSAWSRTAYTASDSRQVETRTVTDSNAYTVNNYYYWRYMSGGQAWYTYSASYAQARGGTKYTFSQRVGDQPAMYYVQSVDGHAEYQLKNNNGGKGVYFDNEWWFLESTTNVPATSHKEYRYRDRSKVYTYSFEKWGDWSGWSTNAVTASTTRQVNTRTVYRYKAPEGLVEDTTGTSRTISGVLDPSFAGKQATLLVYKGAEPADYNNEYVGQTTIGANGEYSFTYITREEPSVKTGDYTISLAIEGATELLYVDKIASPLPTYTVEFVDEDGTLISTQEVEKGSAAVLPENPVKEHYRFIGWSGGTTNIRYNKTLIARYVIDEFVVNWIDWDHRQIQSDVYEYGENLIIPDMPVPEGFSLEGWYANGTGVDNVKVSADTLVTTNLLITARYTQNEYIVNFYDWNGTMIDSQTVLATEAAIAPDAPAVNNMVFMGWSSSDYLKVLKNLKIYANYNYVETAEVPEADVESGPLTNTTTVHLTAEEGASIYYTTDGSVPTSLSTQYTNSGIVVDKNTVLQYIAVVPGKNDSATGVSFYQFSDTEDINGALMIKSSHVTIEKGNETQINYFLSRNDTDDMSVSIFSMSPNVASVTPEGKIVGNKAGTAKILIMTTDLKYGDNCIVTVTDNSVPVENISLNKENVLLKAGEEVSLTASLSPANAGNDELEWYSDDESVATVTEDGKIIAVENGSTTIRAYSADGHAEASCLVYVQDPEIRLNDKSLYMSIGETHDLDYEINGTIEGDLVWYSDFPERVSVDANGKITALEEGPAEIMVQSADGSCRDYTEVFVSKPGRKERVSLESAVITLGSNTVDYTCWKVPEVTVKIGNDVLTEGTDYEVVYGSDIKEGDTSTLYVAGINGYIGMKAAGYTAIRVDTWNKAPKIISIEQIANGTVRIAWDAETFAEAYGIYEVVNGKDVYIERTSGDTFDVKNVTDGTHTYTVKPRRMVNGSWQFGTRSANAFVTVRTYTWDSPAVMEEPVVSGNKVTLSWKSMVVPNSYSVYEVINGKQVYKAKVTETYYNVTNVEPGTHTYCVKPRELKDDGSWLFGQVSNYVTVTIE